jgi:large subunit ribosomal protein L19
MDVGYLLENIPHKHKYKHVRAGDTVKVFYRVVEGERQREQVMQGIVMWMTRSGPNANMTIRRVIDGIGVERTILLNSPMLEDIELVRQGKVRRARLYYQRGRTGRKARIKEGKNKRTIDQLIESNSDSKTDAQPEIMVDPEVNNNLDSVESKDKAENSEDKNSD